MTEQMNLSPTLERFEYPKLLIREYDQWTVHLRRHQATLGALVLIAKSDATAWPALDEAAFTELARITAAIESTLKSSFDYDKINYLMLMMVDPNPHFHIFPRYSRRVSFEGVEHDDPGWPKTPDLTAGKTLEDDEATRLVDRLKAAWAD